MFDFNFPNPSGGEWSQDRAVTILLRPEDPIPDREEVPQVTVYRVVTKTVPDYEAEILCRNGWLRET